MIRCLSVLLGITGLLSLVHAEERTVGQQFQEWLKIPASARPALAEQPFARVPLGEREAAVANRLLWEDRVATLRDARETEMAAKEIVIGEHSLRFETRTFGAKPENGHSLYLSLHGGGGTRAEVNDRQWRNQIGLYEPEEGIYLAPRAPSNTWNLWHRSHIDPLFDRLIENYVLLGEVDPDRVYLLGYSAGGDGVYQLAPRMADRLAAAAMMAGHPNDAKPEGLRNIGFALHMGAEDGAYQRNAVAAEWKTKLADLQSADPDGYAHTVEIHAGKGHWMEREDRAALPWMAKFTRNPHPAKVVWRQDDVTHTRFYWLAMAPEAASGGQKVVAAITGQTVSIEAAESCASLRILLTDALLDLDGEVTVTFQGRALFQGKVPRTLQTLAETLDARPDPTQKYWSALSVRLD